ncbi:MAG: LPS export ABC transporter periplasmic protein LptC [Pyrinomonadaceae bacterium]
MTDREIRSKNYELRAKLPIVLRYFALAAIAVVLLIIVAGFYRESAKSAFKLKSEHTNLSTDVIAEVNGYERLESENGVAKYFIKASHAKTFSDNHQELDDMYLEVYGNDGAVNKLSAENALYVPEPDKNFTAYLTGNVRLETAEALKIKTNNIVYTRKTETADADELVEFERDNLKGRSLGAAVRMADKQIDLLRDVEIETFESPEMAKSGVRYARVRSSSATFDQAANKIALNGGVAVNINSKANSGGPQTTNVQAARAVVYFVPVDGQSPRLKKVELFDNVRIASAESGQTPTNIDAGYALYDKDADRYELKNGAHITTATNEKPTDIRAGEAIFEQLAGKLALTGNADITQGGDNLKGDAIFADLFRDNKIKHAVIRGNASARQVTAERTTSITAPELNATFNEARQLSNANAIGQSTAEVTPVNNASYSNVVMTAARGIGVLFKGEGLIDVMRTDGRTTINLSVPNSQPDSANKRLTADAVKTIFNANGKDIARAEAAGNAELFIEPLNAGKDNYRTSIKAPRFDCEFFATGNNVRSCVGSKKARVARVPTVQTDGRGTQYLTADQLNAQFNERSNDAEKLDAVGNAKFTELERNAIARQMTFTPSDQTVRLRGGEPTVWDSGARAKASEIDWDTRNSKSYLRGAVSTTYYSRKKMRDSSPFSSSEKPVFVTAESAEIDSLAETAVYTGNARGWQENNYVRGNRLMIDQRAGKFAAEGNVQSVLYNAKLRQKSKDTSQPVYAAASSMNYNRDGRLLQYRNSVDIRQGVDRITAGVVDVYLSENNDVAKTVAEQNVVITQPNRRAVGDWAQYTSADEVAIIRGDPATVSDAENGSSQSATITFNMRENKVTSEGKSKQNTSGRTRSVYKVKPTN